VDSIIVNGGNKLYGNIIVSGAKNAALPIMAASLLTCDKVILQNVPRLVDIETMKELLNNHGTFSRWIGENKLEICSENITSKIAPYDIVKKMRASIWVLGPLLTRFGYAEISMPGGCAIGARMVDQHIEVMKALGAKISMQKGYIIAKSEGRLRGAHFNFAKISVGATINGILAATLSDGQTMLSNCASEPEIVDLCNMLNKMGAKISGIGTQKLTIEGCKELHGTTHTLIGDRIEAGTYLCAVGLVGGEITVSGINYNIIENTVLQLAKTGMSFKVNDDNFSIIAKANTIKSVDMQTEVYPGFATDLQAQYMTLMTLGNNTSVVAENIFENRFMHVPELCRMGANISIDGHTAIIRGVNELNGAEVMASDLRASVSLIIAGLAAKTQTKVRRVYHLDRGYENLEKKLQNCGADVHRIHGDSV